MEEISTKPIEKKIDILIKYPLSLVRTEQDSCTKVSILISDDIDYGHDIRKTLDGFVELYQLAVAKGFFYGSSWKKRGIVRSWVANIDRKYDRMDSCVSKNIFGFELIDCIADLAVYCLLGLFNIFPPNVFEGWRKKELLAFMTRYQQLLKEPLIEKESCKNPPSEEPSVPG